MSARENDVAEVLGLAGRRRRPWRRLIWIIVIVGIVAAIYARRGNQGIGINYETDAVMRGPLRVTVTATGTLQPINQVEVGSEVSGEIDEILVDFNDAVSRDQVIARLDTEQLEARFASVRASLAVAEAALAQAVATAEEAGARARRSTELASRNLVSQQTLEQDVAAEKRAVAAVASAQAQVMSARASVQESETALRKAEIRSPIDGIVLAREVELGQTVAASFQTPVLFKLAEDLRSMELRLDIDESDIGVVRDGQAAIFRVDAFPDREFDASIRALHFDPREVNDVVTYEAVLVVSNPDLLLRPGMTATAEIIVAELDEALLVSNRALRFLPPEEDYRAESLGDEDADTVWIREGERLIERRLEIGLASDEFSEVLEGDVLEGTNVLVDVERQERPRGGLVIGS